jgi:hypothetical protein
MLQHLDAGHAEHHDVEHGDIDRVLPREFQCVGAIRGNQDMIIVLEDDFQRLARSFLVIDDQQSRFRARGGLAYCRGLGGARSDSRLRV